MLQIVWCSCSTRPQGSALQPDGLWASYQQRVAGTLQHAAQGEQLHTSCARQLSLSQATGMARKGRGRQSPAQPAESPQSIKESDLFVDCIEEDGDEELSSPTKKVWPCRGEDGQAAVLTCSPVSQAKSCHGPHSEPQERAELSVSTPPQSVPSATGTRCSIYLTTGHCAAGEGDIVPDSPGPAQQPPLAVIVPDSPGAAQPATLTAREQADGWALAQTFLRSRLVDPRSSAAASMPLRPALEKARSLAAEFARCCLVLWTEPSMRLQTRERLLGLLQATATRSQPSISIMLIGPRGVGKTLVRGPPSCSAASCRTASC